MKALPSLVAIGIMLSAACYAQSCPDPKMQRAAIGGDTINGVVTLKQKPLIRPGSTLFNGKTTWVGSTNDIGSFEIKGLRPGTYRLTVKGWGSTTIRVSPALTHSFGNGQTLNYSLMLVDNECIWTVMVAN
jgi:hypothetical protein